MTERVNAPKNGAPRKISPLQKTAQYVAAAVASISLAHAEPANNKSVSTQSVQTTVQTDTLDVYKLKVAKMTEKELRAESDSLAAKIQPLIDTNAPDVEVNPLLDLYDIVADRLDPIIARNTEEAKLSTNELREGTRLIEEIQKQLETPEKVDPDTLFEKLQTALAIHKKYNPELYAANK